MALPEWRRLIQRARFRVVAKQIEVTPATNPHNLRIPAAFVYVVDAHGPRWASEAIATAIRIHHAQARLLVVGERFTETNSFPLFHLGVRGLVHYSDVRRQLAKGVRFVSRGGFWAPRALMTHFVDSLITSRKGRIRAADKQLSRREQDVLKCLLKNLANKEISGQLNISESTVKFHVSNILRKYSVQRRTDLIFSCFQNSAA